MPDSLVPLSVAVVLGTRPEIVKLAPVIKALGDAVFLIHTGQHFDEDMSDVFLTQHDLPEPSAWLSAGGRTRAGQLAHIVESLDRVFAEHSFSAVVVQGDTNSTVAGAIAANAHDIPVVHVEAGLRSFDRAMPEEHNRVIADHLSEVLCAATQGNVDNLLRESIPADRIVLTGNTIVEATLAQLPPPIAQLALLDEFHLQPNSYVLATIHRPENTDDPATLAAILAELADLPLPVVLPLHPRTQAAVARAGCESFLERLRVIPPQPSAPFLSLAANAALLVSDSGGLQEECTVLKRLLVVVRRSTERPESFRDFATPVLPGPAIGVEVRRLLTDQAGRTAALRAIPSPFGDQHAASHIVSAIHALVARRQSQLTGVRA